LTIRGRKANGVGRVEPTAAAVVLPGHSLDKPAATLSEALDRSPGIRTASDGSLGGRSTASIRGASGQHTQIYLDGIPLNGFGGDTNLSALPLGNVDRIEVYRSATPFGFGMPAIGGAVNVVTRRPERRTAGVALGAGSFGSYDGRFDFSLPVSDAAAVLGGVAYRRSKGNFTFLNDKGTAFDASDDDIVRRGNNHGEQVDALAKTALWTDGGTTLTLTQSLYGFRGGLPGNGLRQPTVADRDDIRSLTYVGFDGLPLGQSAWSMAGGGYYRFARAPTRPARRIRHATQRQRQPHACPRRPLVGCRQTEPLLDAEPWPQHRPRALRRLRCAERRAAVAAVAADDDDAGDSA
jgi:outer membrane receptor protein involved in Fe transport